MEKTEIDLNHDTRGIRYSLRRLADSVILTGVILFFTGLYYIIIKAGIPYQDPPPELQIQHAVNMQIGMILLKNGFRTIICAGILRLLLGLPVKTQHLDDGRHENTAEK